MRVGGRQGSCLRECGVQHTARTGPHGIEKRSSLLSIGPIHDSSNSTEKKKGSREGMHHILDVTFVDDECIMLAADDPKSLASVINCCTTVLSTTFQLFKLEVNWHPGKTETVVHMVGKQSRYIVENWRCDDGSFSIPVPQCDKRINVVDRYRHLGTIVMANGNDVPNARLSAKSAKEAYGPLALRFFLGLSTLLLRGSGHCTCLWSSLATPFRCTLHHRHSTPFGLLFLCTTAHCAE